MNQHRKTRQLLIRAGFSAIICFLVLAAGIIGMNRMAKAKQQPALKQPTPKILSVKTIPVTNETISLHVTGYGEAQPVNTAGISNEVTGRIIETTGLKQGEIIKKGDLLFKIDPTDYLIEKQKARIEMELQKNRIDQLELSFQKDKDRLKSVKQNTALARSGYMRLKNLYENNRVGTLAAVETAEQGWHSLSQSQKTLEKTIALYPLQIKEAISGLDEARSNFETARLNVERCVVNAPFDGRIKENNMETGAYFNKGTTLVTLADDTTLEIQVPLSDREAFEVLGFTDLQMNLNTDALFKKMTCTVETLTGSLVSRFQGSIHRIVKYDSDTRTLYLAVRVQKNQSHSNKAFVPLMDGMFCTVILKGNTTRTAVKAPASALNTDHTVYIVRDNRLKTVKADKIMENGDHIYLAGAFEPNDRLITTKLAGPIENTLVNIIPETQADSSDVPDTAGIETTEQEDRS